jgi:hypothetical protein
MSQFAKIGGQSIEQFALSFIGRKLGNDGAMHRNTFSR